MLRVASLIPSATEIVCALGARDALIGRSHECDFPPGVERLPGLTEPKIDLAGSSRALDTRVRTLVEEALSVYHVFAERLRDLDPDVVLTQAQCEVCAVSLRDVETAVCNWVDGRPEIVALKPNTLEDVWHDVRRVAGALGYTARGEALIDQLQARMDAVVRRAQRATTRPRVVCIEWIDPLMAAGNWMPTLVERAGGRAVFGRPGEHAPRITWKAVRAADPDVIVVMPCGFGRVRTRREMPALRQQPGWSALRAVRHGRVFFTDANHFFNRPGPRLVESLEILAELLHPDVFSARHHGTGWEPGVRVERGTGVETTE